MDLIRRVVVFDAADVASVSRFWASMFDGGVIADDERFHVVIDATNAWVIGVQHAPEHVRPVWPEGAPQQVHLDLHVVDGPAALAKALALGADVLQLAEDPDAEHGHHVLADPAGHPFCIGWGHPTPERLAAYLEAEPPG